jgi:hypothetical protein
MSSKKVDDQKASWGDVERGIFEGVFDALANKHSQLDVNFQRTSIRVPGIPASVELNGLVTISVHMRELTEEEKKASAQRNVALMTSPVQS